MSDKKLTKIYQVIQLYKSLYEENSIGHRDELENKFKVYKDDSIQIKIDKFYHFEVSFNTKNIFSKIAILTTKFFLTNNFKKLKLNICLIND